MIENYLLYATIIVMIFFAIPSWFILPFTLGKKFDRIMEMHHLSLPLGFDFLPRFILRANVYALNIALFPDPKKYTKFMGYYKLRFGDFYFRAHASTWDKIQAWYITISWIIGITLVLTIAVIEAIQWLISVL